jgi:hypothetical protein
MLEELAAPDNGYELSVAAVNSLQKLFYQRSCLDKTAPQPVDIFRNRSEAGSRDEPALWFNNLPC